MRRAIAIRFNQLFAPSLPLRLNVRSDLHLARKAWHMLMGMMIVAIYAAGVSRNAGVLMLGTVLILDLFMETARLRSPVLNEKIMRIWGPLMRSCEVNKISGVPYYLAASILAIGIFPKHIAILSILYLACGDPIASLVGIRFGSKSIRLPNGKSLIGTSAGIFVCAVVSWIGLQGLHLDPLHHVILTGVGALAGGAAEILPLEVDDNFSIPIVSGFVLWFSFILLTF